MEEAEQHLQKAAASAATLPDGKAIEFIGRFLDVKQSLRKTDDVRALANAGRARVVQSDLPPSSKFAHLSALRSHVTSARGSWGHSFCATCSGRPSKRAWARCGSSSKGSCWCCR